MPLTRSTAGLSLPLGAAAAAELPLVVADVVDAVDDVVEDIITILYRQIRNTSQLSTQLYNFYQIPTKRLLNYDCNYDESI